ncbi:sigma 54 modulation/S30EA ribosomal C-terminal domain-containing protein [Amycolatopsis sp. YIM 10]|uniref:sigma 54 modulation/S30EA ribosomal C-terminal domain-containing protein n=1 Tax=Amycolatopsis sp. YIM 10 TaxID=2653857 RepID=UPI003519FF11
MTISVLLAAHQWKKGTWSPVLVSCGGSSPTHASAGSGYPGNTGQFTKGWLDGPAHIPARTGGPDLRPARPAGLADYAQRKVGKLGRFAHGPVLDARARLTRLGKSWGPTTRTRSKSRPVTGGTTTRARSGHPTSPLLSTGEAVDRLNLIGLPFQFVIDAERGRGSVLYHRYDGHYGLTTPAV